MLKKFFGKKGEQKEKSEDEIQKEALAEVSRGGDIPSILADLQRRGEKIPPALLVEFAKMLRDVGNAEKSFGMYLQAADAYMEKEIWSHAKHYNKLAMTTLEKSGKISSDNQLSYSISELRVHLGMGEFQNACRKIEGMTELLKPSQGETIEKVVSYVDKEYNVDPDVNVALAEMLLALGRRGRAITRLKMARDVAANLNRPGLLESLEHRLRQVGGEAGVEEGGEDERKPETEAEVEPQEDLREKEEQSEAGEATETRRESFPGELVVDEEDETHESEARDDEEEDDWLSESGTEEEVEEDPFGALPGLDEEANDEDFVGLDIPDFDFGEEELFGDKGEEAEVEQVEEKKDEKLQVPEPVETEKREEMDQETEETIGDDAIEGMPRQEEVENLKVRDPEARMEELDEEVDVDEMFVDLGRMRQEWAKTEEKVEKARIVGTDARAKSGGDSENEVKDLMRQFKEGLRKSIPETDAKSYYDLGISYISMMMFDEAIEALQVAYRSPEYRKQAAEALAQSFVENANPKLARRLTKLTIESFEGEDESELLGLMYWQARAAEELGEGEAARDIYEQISIYDLNFMDVLERIERLES